MGVHVKVHNVLVPSRISKWRVGKPLGFAIDHEVARRLFIINSDGDNDGPRAFGLRPQNLEGANLPIVAVLAPVVKKVLIRESGARLPKLVRLMVVPLLQRG